MVHQEFFVRFYEWSLADALREMEAGFPLVSRITGGHGRRFISALEEVSPGAREELLRLVVRRFHSVAMEILGTQLTDEDLLILEDLQEKRMSWRFPPTKGVRGRLLRTVLEATPPYRSDSKMRPSDLGPSVLGFQVDVGSWTVSTYVDTSKYPTYYHSIRASREFLQSQISVQSWMGIASETEWNLAAPGDEESIALTMREAFKRFLVVVPSLLDGLEPGTSGCQRGSGS